MTGYDGTTYSLYFQPPLKTVVQDFNKLARRAVELIIQHMGAPQMHIHELLPMRLVIRQSSWSYGKSECDMNTQLITQLNMLVEKL
ncbi:TPA: substrate-binding domain-containing protein [Citrobacter freundii]|uniref:Substrate-binding domain-containing protein n=1 Tax=Citrobacter freundii TaxID=546 RepID=A0AAP9TY84_CITFR|nr:hypothetical protein [Salmonella enterica]EKV4145695.1 substrate-binding domain-containing protein [Citrobacter freundii]ECX9013958.1 hypothetical protein [Salmonella enterica]EEU7510363.1 substrate-binding domain-containing protein [Salmonella enterica]ELO3996779.1 substrate-binding domain-containing protein [Citrobacter freundii]